MGALRPRLTRPVMCINMVNHTHQKDVPMRTNIVIDDDLMAEALRVTGLKTKKEVVEKALQTLVRIESQKGILALRGKVHWEGDLDEMRRDRFEKD